MSFYAVTLDTEASLRDYWHDRLCQSHTDTYRGRPLVKIPEDLRTYERIIDDTHPEIILEIGTYQGGSALWFSDRLATICGGGHVVTVDLDPPSISNEHITSLRGDALSASIHAEVMRLCAGRRVLVSEDSAHTYEATLGLLRLYSPLVEKGSWYVVEDGAEDTDAAPWGWGHGVRRAIAEFLGESHRFLPSKAPYGITSNVDGWLEATG